MIGTHHREGIIHHERGREGPTRCKHPRRAAQQLRKVQIKEVLTQLKSTLALVALSTPGRHKPRRRLLRII